MDRRYKQQQQEGIDKRKGCLDATMDGKKIMVIRTFNIVKIHNYVYLGNISH